LHAPLGFQYQFLEISNYGIYFLEKNMESEQPKKQIKIIKKTGGTSDIVYGMAFIGAVIYYIQHATSFWNGVVGVIKAIFWPGFLMYKVLEFLKI
jgi:hypothetical protein